VVLRGSADLCIAKTRGIVSELHADLSVVNDEAFRAGGALWVNAAHPSQGNGRFKAWLTGEAGRATARKRVLGRQALAGP
jgi:hypothetical protein